MIYNKDNIQGLIIRLVKDSPHSYIVGEFFRRDGSKDIMIPLIIQTLAKQVYPHSLSKVLNKLNGGQYAVVGHVKGYKPKVAPSDTNSSPVINNTYAIY